MLAIVVAMIAIVLVSAAVVAYVAYPHRGVDLPGLPGLGRAVHRGVTAMPTLDESARSAEAFLRR